MDFNEGGTVMSKCPKCHKNINDWHILTLGKKTSVTCKYCGTELRVPDKISGVKVFAGTGFLLGGLVGGLCVAVPHAVKWIVFVLIWFLLLALVDIRYTRLVTKPDDSTSKK